MTNEIKIELGDYKGLKATKRKLKVEAKEMENALKYVQNSRAKIITVNEPVKKGNRLEVDFEVRCAGVKVENGESKNHPLILGEGQFLPGFENELEGMKAGEEKEFSLKVPAEWQDKRVAGKNLDFKVKVNIVQERQVPEMNDEFAQSLGNFKTWEDFKKNVEDGLFQEKELMEKQRIRIELIEQVAENSKIDLPKALIDAELNNMINEFKASISQFGLELETYLSQIKSSLEDLKNNWKTQAEKRAKMGLCIKAIADKEKIVPTAKEIEEKMNQELMRYPDIEKAKKEIDLVALKSYTEGAIINEKVFELLEKEAIIK
ncbi:MAG TPA: trigger factor [Candidatus Portnoybacteria bacterium]|nr:trigger factor [Candidatus Portnoybacteria bacterium]